MSVSRAVCNVNDWNTLLAVKGVRSYCLLLSRPKLASATASGTLLLKGTSVNRTLNRLGIREKASTPTSPLIVSNAPH